MELLLIPTKAVLFVFIESVFSEPLLSDRLVFDGDSVTIVTPPADLSDIVAVEITTQSCVRRVKKNLSRYLLACSVVKLGCFIKKTCIICIIIGI